jgi:hypothetical protein
MASFANRSPFEANSDLKTFPLNRPRIDGSLYEYLNIFTPLSEQNPGNGALIHGGMKDPVHYFPSNTAGRAQSSGVGTLLKAGGGAGQSPVLCPVPARGVPSSRNSTLVSDRIRKYCQIVCDESIQSSITAALLFGSTRSARTSEQYLISTSGGPWTLARIRFTLTNTIHEAEKIMRSYGRPQVSGSSTTLPRPRAGSRASFTAFLGGRPRVIPFHRRVPPLPWCPLPVFPMYPSLPFFVPS